MFIVTINNGGNDYFLRSTIWAFCIERAEQFNTEIEAQAALMKAKKFTKSALFKKAVILRTDNLA